MCSCLSAGTLIMMEDGSQKNIEHLEPGDVVFSPLAVDRVATVSKLTMSDATGFPVIRLVLSDGNQLTCSPNHLFINVSGEFVPARVLHVGDKIADSENIKEIVSKELVESYNGAIYNLVISEGSVDNKDHFYIANGVLSGDIVVQSLQSPENFTR